MKEGSRKVKAFYFTQLLIMIGFISALSAGVPSNEISAFTQVFFIVVGAVSGAFFGANFGTHYAQAKGNKG